MKFKKQKINDVYLIYAEPFIDKRGIFKRNFCLEEIKKSPIKFRSIKQINLSQNINKKTLRGFHYQVSPYSDKKIISCVKGSIHNIVLDMRKKSKTYLNWQSFKISEKNMLSLFIPAGCANAYITMEKNTSILYYHSEFYNPQYSRSVFYDDPYFNFDWPFKPKVISEKDNNIDNFKI